MCFTCPRERDCANGATLWTQLGPLGLVLVHTSSSVFALTFGGTTGMRDDRERIQRKCGQHTTRTTEGGRSARHATPSSSPSTPRPSGSTPPTAVPPSTAVTPDPPQDHPPSSSNPPSRTTLQRQPSGAPYVGPAPPLTLQGAGLTRFRVPVSPSAAVGYRRQRTRRDVPRGRRRAAA